MRDIFRNRIEVGQLLAEKLMCYANRPNVILLGLPRRRAGCVRGNQGCTRGARCFRRAQAERSRPTRTDDGCNRHGVGEWYEDFKQTSDAEVTDLLERVKSCSAAPKVAGAVKTESKR